VKGENIPDDGIFLTPSCRENSARLEYSRGSNPGKRIDKREKNYQRQKLINIDLASDFILSYKPN
jgi:hypothetical protein